MLILKTALGRWDNLVPSQARKLATIALPSSKKRTGKENLNLKLASSLNIIHTKPKVLKMESPPELYTACKHPEVRWLFPFSYLYPQSLAIFLHLIHILLEIAFMDIHFLG